MPWCLKFIPISCMGPKHAPKDTDLIFQRIYMHWSMCMQVQIWIMHINALKTELMHKNVQTNPEKSQKFTQHSCCSMLTREKNLKAIRGNGYRFVHKGDTFPYRNHEASLREAPVCKRLVIKFAPKWTKKILDICYFLSLRWFFLWRGNGDAAK